MASDLHEHLLMIMRRLPSDFEPYGNRSRETDWGPDCSCGCKHFVKLEGNLGYDWGVCANPQSLRTGLLTFEHQGCKAFDYDESLDMEIEALRQAQREANPELYRRLQQVQQDKIEKSEQADQEKPATPEA